MPRKVQVLALVAATAVLYALTAGGLVTVPEPLATVAGITLAASWIVAVFAWHNDPYHVVLERRAAGQCIHCGYDLTGNITGVCPECGRGRDG